MAALHLLVVIILAAGSQAVSINCARNCTSIVRPVCGSDRETYNNQCLLEVAGCQLAEQSAGSPGDHPIVALGDGSCLGLCHEWYHCTDEYDPVCANNGLTYYNQCYMEAADCTLGCTSQPGNYCLCAF
ncbi:extracellular protease inhibitor 10-like isoform X2 [Branchiostoma floridae]|uniref:Extracellular protease inhibitor 10-like isoform X2 n=1 Tax=Branchiostoma floridae TaxID=7739 RepID=A0A9J7HHV0_BRAFL|nr:extracellular protease inhibitor 10-like isoform X2 [Branchiostoma floridae]